MWLLYGLSYDTRILPAISFVASLAYFHETFTSSYPPILDYGRCTGHSSDHIDIRAGRQDGGPCVCVRRVVYFPRFSPGGRATGVRVTRENVRLWGVQTGAHLQLMMGHRARLYSHVLT